MTVAQAIEIIKKGNYDDNANDVMIKIASGLINASDNIFEAAMNENMIY